MKINNVSFVIITLNEEYAIKKCLTSIKNMELKNCEVICIDSDSSDNTMNIIKSFIGAFEAMKIYKIKGDVNAAIARNVGIKQSNCEYVFFVDGDTELKKEFLFSAIEKIKEGNYSAITGKLKEYQYSESFKEVLNVIEDRTSLKEGNERYFSGGNFIATRKSIENTGLFNESLKINEDFDFTLRLSYKYKMGAIPLNIGIHHTIPYHSKDRLIDAIIKKNGIYIGRTIRNNINNLRGIKSYLIIQSGTSFGIVFYALLIFIVSFNIKLLVFLPFIIVLDMLYGVKQKKDVCLRFVSHYVFPPFIIMGFLFFKKVKHNYKILKIYPSSNINKTDIS